MKVKKFNFMHGNERQERLYKAKMALNKLTLDKISRKVGFSIPYVSMIIKGTKYNKKVVEFLDDLPGMEA